MGCGRGSVHPAAVAQSRVPAQGTASNSTGWVRIEVYAVHANPRPARAASFRLSGSASRWPSSTRQVSSPPKQAPVSMPIRCGRIAGAAAGVWPCTTTAAGRPRRTGRARGSRSGRRGPAGPAARLAAPRHGRKIVTRRPSAARSAQQCRGARAGSPPRLRVVGGWRRSSPGSPRRHSPARRLRLRPAAWIAGVQHHRLMVAEQVDHPAPGTARARQPVQHRRRCPYPRST